MTLLWIGLLLTILVVVITERARRPATADAWAAQRDLPLSDRSRALVHWYLDNGAAVRRIGILGGILLPPLIVWSLGIGSPAIRLVDWHVFLGYVVGGIYAEISLVRRPGAGGAVAIASARRLDDYLPRLLVLVPRVLGGLCAAAAVIAVIAGVAVGEADGRTGAVAAGVASAMFAGGLELVERWVVLRPQPFAEPDLIAADDAIRSASLHAIAAGGIAVLLFGLAAALRPVVLAVDDPVRSIGTAFVVLAPWVAMCTLPLVAHRAWRVRRPVSAAS